MKLDNEILTAFADRFLGYGNPSASHWFVAMEEGGGNSMDEIAARFAAWDKRGRREFDDMKAFCRDTGHVALTAWGSDAAPRQKTWIGLIQTLEITADPLTYQRTKWLTETGETCLVNLLPLPSPGTDTWHYSAWSDLPELRTRKGYTTAFVGKRIERIRRAIQTHKPERVTFVGTSNAAYWAQIREGMVGVAFDTMTHPAARGNHATLPAAPYAKMESKKEVYNMAIPTIPSLAEDKKIFLGNLYQWLVQKHLQSMMEGRRKIIPLNDKPNELWQAVGKKNGYEIFASYVTNEAGTPFCIEYKLSGVKDKDQIKILLDKTTEVKAEGEQFIHQVDWKRDGKAEGKYLRQ